MNGVIFFIFALIFDWGGGRTTEIKFSTLLYEMQFLSEDTVQGVVREHVDRFMNSKSKG